VLKVANVHSSQLFLCEENSAKIIWKKVVDKDLKTAFLQGQYSG